MVSLHRLSSQFPVDHPEKCVFYAFAFFKEVIIGYQLRNIMNLGNFTNICSLYGICKLDAKDSIITFGMNFMK